MNPGPMRSPVLCGAALLGAALLAGGMTAGAVPGAAPAAAPAASPSARADRRMAITIDDLPCVRCDGDVESIAALNRRVLEALGAAGARATGFVNEAKLQKNGERDRRVAILNAWLDAGMALGNHGYAHRGLTLTPLREYQADVLRGEVVTRALLESRGLKMEFYRHPYTQTGPTPEIKGAFEAFLAAHGYRVAPFTIEDADYMFDALYTDALGRGDAEQAARLRDAALAHATRMVAWFEDLARESFGREPAQILLIHVNRLNADTLGERFAALRARGYRFITLEQALDDPLYAMPEQFVGKNGPSWLHRLAVARGLPSRLRDEPDPPQWVMDAWNARTAAR